MRNPVCWAIVASCALACGDNGKLSGGAPDAGADAPAEDDGTRVAITSGPVHGARVDDHVQFLGIPYAAPPVGALRWKAPQKPASWTAPFEATAYSKRCAQLASPTLMNDASDDEDCLYLNVWAPAKAHTKLPVMVWLHGGGNINGSTSERVPFVNRGYFYTGELLAERHDVVVVSLNYRLGIFGFFAHPELTAEGIAGNQGLLDQRLALQWVHDNAAAFGGDPDNVTIFGESAGSLDVCLHVASPGSAGLFHKAISESGGCTTKMRTKAEAEAGGTAFATSVGCTGAYQLDCLRAKAAAALMATPAVAAGDDYGPDVDGAFMPEQPRALYDSGRFAKVPYLLGSNTDEGTLFLGAVHPTNQTQYMAALTQLFPTSANAVANLYPTSAFLNAMPNPYEAALARVIGDSRLVCPTFDSAARVAHAGVKVWMYNYDIPAPVELPGTYLGATHGSELVSVFGTSPLFTPATQAVSDLMQRYWTNFARTGTPNAAPDLTWPALTDTANVRLNFGLQPTVVTDFRATLCDFWRAGYAAQF